MWGFHVIPKVVHWSRALEAASERDLHVNSLQKMVACMHSELLTVSLRKFHCVVLTLCTFSHAEIKENLLKTHKIASQRR